MAFSFFTAFSVLATKRTSTAQNDIFHRIGIWRDNAYHTVIFLFLLSLYCTRITTSCNSTALTSSTAFRSYFSAELPTRSLPPVTGFTSTHNRHRFCTAAHEPPTLAMGTCYSLHTTKLTTRTFHKQIPTSHPTLIYLFFRTSSLIVSQRQSYNTKLHLVPWLA